MLHLILSLNAVLVIIFLIVRMCERDHVADPFAVLLWLLLCLFDTRLLFVVAALVTLVSLYEVISSASRLEDRAVTDAG